MVVRVADSDVERHTAVELTQNVLHVTAVLEDEINDVEIAIACLGAAAIRPQSPYWRQPKIEGQSEEEFADGCRS